MCHVHIQVCRPRVSIDWLQLPEDVPSNGRRLVTVWSRLHMIGQGGVCQQYISPKGQCGFVMSVSV